MTQIDRTGKVTFGDASVNVWEDLVRRGWDEWQEYERGFKSQTFKRIVQQLNRLGWSVEVPADMIEQYGRSFAEDYRHCRKGNLQGLLDLSGRCIKFEMWQDVANVDNPNGGRYDFDKEQRMPYLLRLEMERTRRRIRDYLCNVFSGYEFQADRNDGRSNKRGPGSLTAVEWVDGCYQTSWHFKGDITNYEIAEYNRKSGDGAKLSHGQRVWFADRKGRICTGIAYYNINNMWWVVTGKFDVSNESASNLYSICPENPKQKRNGRLRRKRLESELSKAVKSMDFLRAQKLKEIVFPTDEPLFMVYHKGHGCYHRSSFCGYTKDTADAGRFTWEELGPFRPKDGSMEDNLSKIVSVEPEVIAA
ncbi:hypothetical protein [Marinobacter sp. KMM 10035]|uniref:hypothetical protein n=1 Tax=Marinobacter sp. KMM 10035 TaxID=3134034 RepID=UPI003978B281